MLRILVLAATFAVLVSAIDFGGSSSESCEDDGHGHGHGNGNGNGGANRGCDAGWKRFNRPAGGWCMRSFGGILSRDSAEAQCQTLGATLSGFQSFAEAQWVSSEFSFSGKFFLESFSIYFSICRLCDQASQWLSLDRSTSQWLSLDRSTVTTAFVWTDAFTTGTAGFNWDNKQPDNKDLNQPCAIVLAAHAPIHFQSYQFQPAMMDDAECAADSVASMGRTISGYVCGKPARQ